MKNYRSDAVDLLDRLQAYQDKLDREQLVKMIEDLLMMTVQDYINEQNFKDVESGDTEAELKVLFSKSLQHAEECDAYLEAAFLTVCELERDTKEDRFIAAKINMTDAGKTVRNAFEKIDFIKKQLKLE